MTGAEALARLKTLADPDRAARDAACHKAPRVYLGVPVPRIGPLVAGWRADASIGDRVALARALWDSDVHEARIAAAKLLTQSRIRPDGAVWDAIRSWVPQFDAWAIADAASSAGERRLVADPSRLDEVEGWVAEPSMWVRRAALVMTLPWTKQNYPSADDRAIRERVLDWCATLAPDREWFIQKAVAGWLRSLSRHDPGRVDRWLADHGDALKPFARKDAARRMP